jgi:Radical SAM superfamily/4Fe-4S single cluster domain/Iron-sulfur cluster-binding domain
MIHYLTVGLCYTRTCPLKCADCIIESSPQVRGKMSKASAHRYLEPILQFSPEVCFTGGEPMLYYSEVLELAQAARAMGLGTTMVTGAGWVSLEKPEIARERIFRLAEAGMRLVCVSWDQYHEEFAPREKAQLVVDLALEAGMEVSVRGVIPATADWRAQSRCWAGQPVKYEPVKLIKLGAAKSLPSDQFYWKEELPKGLCTIVLTPVIEPDGTVYACCGPGRYALRPSPLVLGNANEELLEEIFARAANDPVLEALSLIGPYGMTQLLQEHPATKEHFYRRPKYTGICELCLDITDSPELVAALRTRLADADAQRLLTAARMWLQEDRRRRKSCGHAADVPAASETTNEEQEKTYVA